MEDPKENGYVECGECGHPIEDHDTTGCNLDECTCRQRWTQKEIRRVRIREGLPGRQEVY